MNTRFERLTFSAEGKVLVAAGLEDYVVDGRLVYVSSFTAWDASTGRQLYRIAGATNDRWIRSAIAANAGILAAATERVVVIWDGIPPAGGAIPWANYPSRPTMLAFSPDGHALACGFEDGSVTVWDASTAPNAPLGFRVTNVTANATPSMCWPFRRTGGTSRPRGRFVAMGGSSTRTDSEMRIFSLVGRLERATM